MRILCVSLILSFCLAVPLRSQNPQTHVDDTAAGNPSQSPSQDDSVPHIAHPRLLPDQMSFVEKGLWGEHGMLRSIGIASPLTPEGRKTELGLRRTMLTIHQVGGFVTLGLMAGSLYYGQRIFDGGFQFERTHQTLVAATIASYSATALAAILSPPPLIRRNETSTITLHKTLAWIHVAGMIITPILGKMIKSRQGYDLKVERWHQVSAYITSATYAASIIVITF